MDKAEIGKRIREIREFLGISQREFAEILGIHPLSVSRYELGKSNPSPSVLKAIEDKFGVNPEWLLAGKGEPFKSSKESDNFNFKFNKRWKAVEQRLEESAELIVDLSLELFVSKKHVRKLNNPEVKTFFKNRIKRHLLKEADRSLWDILTLISCMEKEPPFDKFLKDHE